MSQPTSSPARLAEPMPYALPEKRQVGKVRGEVPVATGVGASG